MRSPAERRIPWERAARGAALALVLLSLLLALRTRGDASALSVHFAGALDPSARVRDSLGARARAGDAVRWSGEVAAVATASEPLRDPSARTVVSAVSDGALALGDSLGELDSLPAGGGAITASGLRGAVRAREGRTGASSAAPAAVVPGRVLVLGRVGWDSKFVIAALEEAGWSVDARLRLSDTLRLSQGDVRAPTIALQSVVVALDTVLGADAAALTRFVRAGGGLVLSGEAAAAPALAAILPARAGARLEGEPGAFDASEPQHALPMRTLARAGPDAVILERRDGAIAVAARRIAAGRVLQSGYEETWRWRMQAGGTGAQDHREWWSRLVAGAAASATAGATASTDASADAGPVASPDESAPRAALVQRLGPPVSAAPVTPSDPRALPLWMGAIILVLLVAEWASRRARGAA